MIHTLTDKAIAVNKPGHIIRIAWEKGNEGKVLWMFSSTGYIHYDKRIRMPEGSWEILSKSAELTGGEMLSLIEKENDGSGHLNSWWYKNYVTGENTKDFRASYESLLQSKGLTRESFVIILIKQQ